MNDSEILKLADQVLSQEPGWRKSRFTTRVKLAFARAVEAAVLERVRNEEGESNEKPAAAQNRVKELREALEQVVLNPCEQAYWLYSVEQSLSTPDDFSALDAVLKAERERVAQMILNGSFLHTEAPVAIWAREIAAAIRSMT